MLNSSSNYHTFGEGVCLYIYRSRKNTNVINVNKRKLKRHNVWFLKFCIEEGNVRVSPSPVESQGAESAGWLTATWVLRRAAGGLQPRPLVYFVMFYIFQVIFE